MSLQHLGYIELPPHERDGGFDHAAFHRTDDCLYVAHTANDAVEVIDCAGDRYLRSIPGLAGMAGGPVPPVQDLLVQSDQRESITLDLESGDHAGINKVVVEHHPDGL